MPWILAPSEVNVTSSPIAIFYDGQVARRRSVTLSITADALVIVADDEIQARWPWWAIRHQTEAAVLRATCLDAPGLARLEVHAPDLAETIRARSPIGAAQKTSAGTTARILIWSTAAAASLIVCALVLVPRLADRLGPLIPRRIEQRIGDAIDPQIRALIDSRACTDPAGKAALATLSARVGTAAALSMVRVDVVRSRIANAVTLPGGHIYLFRGLIDQATDADELAGVLAHEMSHLVHRDPIRKVLEIGGTSFLFGLLLGDVTGAGTVVVLARALNDSAYSRKIEASADAFTVSMLGRLGRPTQPMADLLQRIDGDGHRTFGPLLQDHPATARRAAAIRATGSDATRPPLLDAAEWKALKAVCR